MNASHPRQADRTPSFDVEVMLMNGETSFPSLLTLTPLQLQSILNSPLINTNEVIPEPEQSRVRSVLQDIGSELEAIETEIMRAQEYILLLQDKQAGYVKDMNKLRPAIAPHKSLPPEIFVEIFLHYAAEIAEQVINEAPKYCRLSRFPWVLGHICSRWRRIALAEPRIWGTIGVNAGECGDLIMLNEAFRRGGQSQLWLSADEGENEKYVYDEFLRDVICSQSTRITELSLFVFPETFENFFSLPSESFPMLETVRLVAKGLGLPWMPGSDASVFRGAERLRRIKIPTPLDVTPVSFPMNLCLCWPHLTHIDFPEISIQVSIAHELMKLCTNLLECNIRLEDNWETLPPVWIKSYPPSSIRIPYLWRLVIHQEDEIYVARVFNAFLCPLVMPNLEQLDFSLEGEPDIVPTLLELTAIVNGLSRPNLVSEMLYLGESGLAEVTSALPFVTSLVAPRNVLASSEIRMMAQKDHLPNLTSLMTCVAYADMDAFIDMLEARWVRGIDIQLSPCGSTAGIIQSAKIYVGNAPSPHSIFRLLKRICDIQDRLKLQGAMIKLQPIER